MQNVIKCDVQAFPRYLRRMFYGENLFARHSLPLRRTRILIPLPVPFFFFSFSFTNLYKVYTQHCGIFCLHSFIQSCLFSIRHGISKKICTLSIRAIYETLFLAKSIRTTFIKLLFANNNNVRRYGNKTLLRRANIIASPYYTTTRSFFLSFFMLNFADTQITQLKVPAHSIDYSLMTLDIFG